MHIYIFIKSLQNLSQTWQLPSETAQPYANYAYQTISHNRRNHITILKLFSLTLPIEPTISTIIYSHIYPSKYEVSLQFILSEQVLVRIQDYNNDQFI